VLYLLEKWGCGMTKELLNEIENDYWNEKADPIDMTEVFDLANKALEQEPCEDCISRQAVIDGINQYFHDEYYQRTSIQDCMDCLIEDAIKPLQPVTPKPKMGHWKQYGDSWEDKFKCSECGKEQPKILCGKQIIGDWSDYCPNCGARMVEPQESEDKE
jgi:DNA-directed RNA polymerase subunit RPC12/RpoP